MVRSRLRALVVSTLLSAAFVMVDVLPAAAAPPCEVAHLCVWWNANYQPGPGQTGSYNFEFDNWWNNWAIKDDDSSWYDNGVSTTLSVQVQSCGAFNCSRTVCLRRLQGISYSSTANDRGDRNDWFSGSC
jgi:hypothetical protein